MTGSHDTTTAWSVTVVGHAQQITDVDELAEVAGTFVQPWVDGRRDHFMRIRSEILTRRASVNPAYLSTGAGRGHDHGVVLRVAGKAVTEYPCAVTAYPATKNP